MRADGGARAQMPTRTQTSEAESWNPGEAQVATAPTPGAQWRPQLCPAPRGLADACSKPPVSSTSTAFMILSDIWCPNRWVPE